MTLFTSLTITRDGRPWGFSFTTGVVFRRPLLVIHTDSTSVQWMSIDCSTFLATQSDRKSHRLPEIYPQVSDGSEAKVTEWFGRKEGARHLSLTVL